ncbi:TIGR04104 family putative zinc finger protein [Sutcliffiella halmapala]|uniref:TIGR04104 family putative zinc finger protein n=1 Tax=Sutcliffiella halmapala TaxID=79882 RepID=UPI000994F4DE|nr:TIGR04104 family putative zinc finger protein [Sutcliffiella halmapala]
MSFHQCENCNENVKYKTKLWSVFFGYRPITCKTCGIVYEVDERYRFLFSLYTIMIPIILVYMITAIFGIESKLIQVLFVLVLATISVFYAANRIGFHKSKYQPIEDKN